MKILIDIGHPAHIHYFKHTVKILQKKGYDFLFVVRERDSTIELIRDLGFKYISRGSGGSNLISKLLFLPATDFRLYRIAKAFKPNLFLSFGSPYAAQAAWLMRKPHIAFDDTERAVFEHILYRPFSDVILSPSCYNAKLSRNHLLFDSYMELCYLHPNHFKPDPNVYKLLNIDKDEKYCVLRFISWNANHDVGQRGLNNDDKIKIVNELNKYCKVFISSEQALPEYLSKYKLNIHPSKLHDVLNYASLYIGEGGTTASESAVLGTPAIYVNTLSAGLFEDEMKYGLLYHLLDIDEVIDKAKEILSNENPKSEYVRKRTALLSDKFDTTAFMVWFIENFPDSKLIMQKDSNYTKSL